MGKKKITKVTAALLTTVLVSSFFAGCGSSSKDKNDQSVSYNLGVADLKTIDPGLNNSVEGGNVIVNAFEGLTNLNSKDQPVEGVAEKWDISADGLTYTFHLRNNAKWSDGKAVTAKDFEYAWKRALDPDTASDYATQLYYLKNGQGYNESKLDASKKTQGVKPATKDEVGVKATDDYTLVVNLENPTPYFLSLAAFPTYMPLRQDIVDKDPKGWATKVSTYVSNGPFKMDSWKLKDKLTFVKNDNYWNKSHIKLDKITYRFLDQESSAMAAFDSNQVDVNDIIPAVQKPSLIKSGKAIVYPYLGTYFYCISIGNKAQEKVLKDVKVREALSLAIDRQSIVDNVTKGGEKPATSLVPNGVIDSTGNNFKNKDYWSKTGDVAQAKKLLAEAGYPDGKGFPKIEILYNTSQNHQDIAQAVQDMLRKNLNVEVTLRNVERKVHITTLTSQEFQICRTAWIGDYNDPMTFLDMWMTGAGNNNAGYSNTQYDSLVNQAKAEQNAAKRTEIMHQAEDILMADLPIIPIYEYTNVVAVKSDVKGLHKSALGMVYFYDTYIKK